MVAKRRTATRSGPQTFLRQLTIVLTTLYLPLFFGNPSSASAAGSAYFILSPSSGSHKVGTSLVITLSEYSAPGDNTNAVQANLSYPKTLLQYKSISLSGPFTLCPQQSGGNGSVAIGCAATAAQAGTQSIAKVTFSVLAKGTAAVHMSSGSDIDDTSGASVWNGVLPDANFSLTSATTSTGPPLAKKPKGSGTPITKPKSAPTSSSNTKTTPKIPIQKPAPTASTPATTPKAVTQSPTASLEVTVTDSSGNPVKNARVVVDDHYSENTDAQGKAGFSALHTGNHKVVITANGKKTSYTTVVLAADQTKTVSLKLAGAAPSTVVILLVTIVAVAILAGATWYFRNFRNRFPGGATPNGEVVVGGQPPKIKTAPSDSTITPPVPAQQASDSPTSHNDLENRV